MMFIDELREKFRDLYGAEPRIFSAPGRVNLIGEHTDYNDGFVLPMAIDRRTFVAAAGRDDRLVRCVSAEFEGRVEFELSPGLRPANDWANHVRGMAACLLEDEFSLGGADLLIESDLPIGAGLSSSAALEIAVGYAWLKIYDQLVDPVDLAMAAQRAEQEFSGTQCGIMDQYVSCLGVKNHALLIDCRSLEYRAVPIDLEHARIVVCNSMVRHELTSGQYNRRRAECQEGVKLLSAGNPDIRALRDVQLDRFDLYADSLPETIRRRCNHVLAENARTLEAVEALEHGDLEQFGRLMYASHESLKRDFEVSCRELDLLVEIASQINGVFGARMTGGGFGGCTVNLVAAERIDPFMTAITRRYETETGIRPECYVCTASEGVKENTSTHPSSITPTPDNFL